MLSFQPSGPTCVLFSLATGPCPHPHPPFLSPRRDPHQLDRHRPPTPPPRTLRDTYMPCPAVPHPPSPFSPHPHPPSSSPIPIPAHPIPIPLAVQVHRPVHGLHQTAVTAQSRTPTSPHTAPCPPLPRRSLSHSQSPPPPHATHPATLAFLCSSQGSETRSWMPSGWTRSLLTSEKYGNFDIVWGHYYF